MEYYKCRLKPVSFVVLVDNPQYDENVFQFEERFKLGKKQLMILREPSHTGERKCEPVPSDYLLKDLDWMEKMVDSLKYIVLMRYCKPLSINGNESGITIGNTDQNTSEYHLLDKSEMKLSVNLIAKGEAHAQKLAKELVKLVTKLVLMSRSWARSRGDNGQLDVCSEILDLHDGSEDREQLIVRKKDLLLNTLPELQFKFNFSGDKAVNFKLALSGLASSALDLNVPKLLISCTLFRDDVFTSASSLGKLQASDVLIWIEERMCQKRSSKTQLTDARFFDKLAFYKALTKTADGSIVNRK